ncbi:MAG: aldehyde dehydrogenase family protein [Myxococcota bacterium]
MSDTFSAVSPADGSVFATRPFATASDVETALTRADAAARTWRKVPLSTRLAQLSSFVDAVVAKKAAYAEELTLQMGRPARYAAGELGGFEERARRMLALAEDALAPVVPPPKDGFRRYIQREALGVVLVLAPWNYPWLTAVNAIVPALAAGNTVVLKHSDQTPLVAERLSEAAAEAGLPDGVLQHVHASHERVAAMVADPRVQFVAFTGSVEGGRAVHEAAGKRFIHVGLELGGKDPAYVRADAPFAHTVENVVDGAFFNSGQSCCAIERVYVHEALYDRFVEAVVAQVKTYVVSDPRSQETTLGPLVRARNAATVRAQIDAAIAAGARGLIDASTFGELSDPYLAPQVLVDVTHEMAVMNEETFGPAVGIMRVASDDEALALMNDSRYGLTASIWTTDLDVAEALGQQIETGTVFMNRADYLDPDLAWVGIKDSGRGCTLSAVGYEALTRPKSFHLREV